MYTKIFKFVIIQSLILEALTSQVQPSVKQYLHVTGAGPYSQSSGLAKLPTISLPSRQPCSITPLPSTGFPAFSTLSLPSIVSGVTKSPSISSPGLPILSVSTPTVPFPNLPLVETPKTNIPAEGVDGNVLNNLAIALQLLIISNILNMPLVETSDSNPLYEAFETMNSLPPSYPPVNPSKIYATSKPTSGFEIYEPLPVTYGSALNSKNYPVSTPNSPIHLSYEANAKGTYNYEPLPHHELSLPSPPYQPQSMPNVNFVGSSSFIDSGLGSLPSYSYGSPAPNPRSSFTLMSPYEALGPNSPFSDPIISSPYGSIITSKKDFQSPYAAILSENDDLFTMDLF